MKFLVYVDRVYDVVSQVKSPESSGSPFRLVTVKMKSVGQVEVAVDVTFSSKKVCTFAAASIP